MIKYSHKPLDSLFSFGSFLNLGISGTANSSCFECLSSIKSCTLDSIPAMRPLNSNQVLGNINHGTRGKMNHLKTRCYVH